MFGTCLSTAGLSGAQFNQAQASNPPPEINLHLQKVSNTMVY